MNVKISEQIMKYINNGEFYNITKMSSTLNIPRTTLVRQLSEMEKAKKVELSWGNVRKVAVSTELIVKSKIEINADGKRVVATKAAMYIKDGDIIYIDSGSTTAYLVDLVSDKKIVIYTNNTFLFQETRRTNFKPVVYVVPGEFYPNTSSIVGSLALNFLKNIYIDKAFLGTNAVNKNELFTTNQEEAILKSEMIRHAHTTYVLYDSTKIGSFSKYKFGVLGKNVKGVSE